MNPLGNGNNNNTPFNPLMQFLDGGGNPQEYFNQMLQNNPQAKQTIEHLRNVSGGASPRDIAMQLAKQKGIPQAQLNMIAKKMGIK